MGSWADSALLVSGVRVSITATAAVAAATAGNDREHQHSNWKEKQRILLHSIGAIPAEQPYVSKLFGEQENEQSLVS